MTEILCLDRTVVQKKNANNKKQKRKTKQNKAKPKKKTIYEILCVSSWFINYSIVPSMGKEKVMYYVLYVFTIKLLPTVKQMF